MTDADTWPRALALVAIALCLSPACAPASSRAATDPSLPGSSPLSAANAHHESRSEQPLVPRAGEAPSVWFATRLGWKPFEFVSLYGREELSQQFRYEVRVRVSDTTIDVDSLIGTMATAGIRTPSGMTYVNGYVNKVETVGGPALAALPEGGENGGGRTIELTLVPWTWLLSKRADCAVFQQQDVPGLLAHFLDERPFSAYRMPLGRDYPRAPFFIQYRETDLNFLQRLAEHVGLTMSFTHGPVGHELVFLDLAKDHHFDGTPTVLDAKNTTDVHRTSDLVTEQFVLRASQTGATASVLEGTSASRGAAPERLRMYDFEGSAERQEDVSFYAQLREDEQKSSGGRLRARVHGQPVRSGDVVTLTQSESLNGSYLVVAADMQIGLSSEGTEVVLDVGIDARPASEAFRPERRTPWPIVNGPQIAQVVESSARDSSRVKVRFQWVRDGRAASDLWLPITREALGLRSTMPAAGSEVLVDFLEGEPGRPIVVGVVSK